MSKSKFRREPDRGYRIWQMVIAGMVLSGVLSLAGFFSGDGFADKTTISEREGNSVQPFAPDLNYGEFNEATGKVMQAMISGPGIEKAFVEYVMVGGLPIFEGDIVLNLDRGPALSSIGVNKQNYLWPDGLIPYEIDPKLPNQNRILDAIEHWEAHTPIRFIERTPETASKYPNYVYFKPSFGCWSYVGMVGGRQDIGLAAGCSTGNTVHEIGHAIGLWHEQSRADRDEYITIHWENIDSRFAHNFSQHIADGVDLGEYDYASIMHYPKWAFSKNGKDTITPRGNHEIGQRAGLSEGDIAGVLELYESVPAR